MADLIACGNSICCSSAIAAVAPIHRRHDIAASIAFTAAFRPPFLAPLLRLSLSKHGPLVGLPVYVEPQVLVENR